MKSLSILLLAILFAQGFKHQTKNPQTLIQLSKLKAQDDITDLEVDLDSSNVPTINSPEENEEYATSMEDSYSNYTDSDEVDDGCMQGYCTHKMKEKMQDNYFYDEDEEEEDSDSDSNVTMPCDYGREITEEQRDACQDYCEQGDCECVDLCYDLMEFVGDAASGLLSYLQDYFEDIGGLAELAQGAYQTAILETLGQFYGSISDNLGVADDGFDFDLDSTELDTSGFDYDQDGLDMDEDTSSDEDDDEDDDDEDDDDEDCDCDCDCQEKQSTGHPCACAHLVNSQKLNPLAEVVGSTVIENVINDEDETEEAFLQKRKKT